MEINSGSFRDPSGSVFSRDGRIFRAVFESGRKDFEAAGDAGVFDRLFEAGIMVSHEEIALPPEAPDNTLVCLEHPRLPMISYPWEQPFSMLKDAAPRTWCSRWPLFIIWFSHAVFPCRRSPNGSAPSPQVTSSWNSFHSQIPWPKSYWKAVKRSTCLTVERCLNPTFPDFSIWWTRRR